MSRGGQPGQIQPRLSGPQPPSAFGIPPALRGERYSELPYPNPNATAISAAAAEKFIV